MNVRTLLALCMPVLSAAGAQAAERQATLQGAALAIDTPCARSVSITMDPALHNSVRVLAAADHQEELDRLTLESGDNARIGHAQRECWDPDHGENLPTLALTVQVPAGFGVAIEEASVAHYTVGDVGGALKLDLSGAGEVTAASAAGLVVDLSGSGTVDVQRVGKLATVAISGHGRIDLRQADVGVLDADLSGAGGITVGGGRIGRAKLDVSGTGAVAIDAETGDADVSLSGVGSVRFAKVTGSLRKDVSGLGNVTVGPR